MTILQTVNLVKEYKMGRDNVVRALGGLNLKIDAGEFVAIMGPSGSGKSTLLHMLGCLDTPTSGQVIIDGEDVGAAKPKQLPAIRNRKIGFIFQQHHLIPTLNAIENVMLPLKYAGVSRAQARVRAEEMLKEVGLEDRMHHRPTEMSGGQQQRVAIARALVTNPALVLADEPTGALDTVTGHQVIEILRKINRTKGVTFAIVTHNPEVASVCERTIVLRDGLVRTDEYSESVGPRTVGPKVAGPKRMAKAV